METVEEDHLITDKFIKGLEVQHPRDIADQISYFDILKIRKIFRRLPDELTAEVIPELPTELQIRLFEAMRINRLSGIISEMFSDDVADVLGQVSAKRLREIMASLSEEDATEITGLLKYPEDSAGGIMQTEFVAVNEELSIAEARERIRADKESDTEGFFYSYAVDEAGRLSGVLRIRDLLFRNPEMKVKDVMVKEVRCVSVHADQEEIVEMVQKYHFVAIPVVDDFGRLKGVVTNDDVIEVINEEATEDMQRMVGLSGEEMVDTPWKESIRNRLPWLYLNLGTAFLAAWVISFFENTIEALPILAVFLPIVAGQGGNAGVQTLTIVVRALALGEITLDDQTRILVKELIVALLSGLAMGIAVGLIAWLWKGVALLGIVIGAAMVLNMLAAAISGVVVPLGLKALKIDPALASAIMVTTVTDVVGFFVFLGFAAMAFHFFPLAL